jgi:hypothetical protein
MAKQYLLMVGLRYQNKFGMHYYMFERLTSCLHIDTLRFGTYNCHMDIYRFEVPIWETI